MKFKRIFHLVIMSGLILASTFFLIQTSTDTRWGGGLWERWLVEQFEFQPLQAHQLVFWIRKTIHFTGYGLLGLFYWLYFRLWGLKHAWWIGMLATSVVAALDEYTQSLSTFRSGQWQDVLLDITGTVIIGLLVRKFCRQ